MARLQILELPEGAGDDRPPFVLVVDECQPQRIVVGIDSTWQDHWQQLADKIGARGVIVTPDTIDIPANDTPDTEADEVSGADFTTLSAAVRNALGIDITEGAPDIAGWLLTACRELEKRDQADGVRMRVANECKAALTEALGLDRLRDWDDIRNAAAGIRRDREAKTEALENVRSLHRPVEHRGQTICWECSGYDFPGQTTDSTPVAHDQCSTLRALNAERDETSPSRG
ncbi:hypothetical protein [Streptomyces rubiginosohelvolus]|uniref:hypothetical protein n=1 Tax=Streptomyces rubiginosohelvolus TaxID=67362 RepID=UPI0036BA5B45